MDRVILHSDCNSFFASCECILAPELSKVPMAVCGDPENRHGIILAKNELAKGYGVKTAETIYQARRKCPELVLVRSHHGFYEEISEKCNAIYRDYTDMVEPFGIDESWLDVTGSRKLFGEGEEIAERIRRRFKEEIGITCSIGVSFNKPFAKLGSDYKKPDAITVISKENFKDIVWPMPVSELLFVGQTTSEALKKHAIYTIGDLALAGAERAVKILGKSGTMLHSFACGTDETPVEDIYTKRSVKSVSNGHTFKKDLTDLEDIKTGIMMLSETVSLRLREYGLKGTVITVQIKYSDFSLVSHQRSLDYSTDLMHDIWQVSYDLLIEAYNGRPIRAITIGVSDLIEGEYGFEQLSLFNEGKVERQKQEGLEDAVQSIRQKYGADAMSVCGLMKNEKR